MKKIIRLTESDLHRIIERSVSKILREGVLGNDWRQDEDDVLNNYEPFEDQIDRYEAETEFRNQHDWGAQGEEDIDPTHYDQHSDVIGWNDDEPEGYEEDIDWYRDDVNPINDSPSDGDLYRGMW
jgi:hypothetical protein